MKHRGTGRRPLALTAAATIALSGLFISAPAFAEDGADLPADPSATTSETAAPEAPATEAPATEAPAEEQPPAAEEPPAELVETFEAAAASDIDAVAYGQNANDEWVFLVTEATTASDQEIQDFADSKSLPVDVVAKVDAAPTAWADGDFVGGQGYLVVHPDDNVSACSVGFAAFAPDGSDAFLSAGHCAFNAQGTKLSATTLSIPNQEPAVGGPGFEVPNPPVLLGTFGFAQFGSTGNAAGSNGDTNATDISVIDVVEANGWNPLPSVTDWTTAGTALDSLAASTFPVKAVGSAVPGSVSKSGRTTGFTTGTIDGDDIIDGWANIDGRFVQGFSSNTVAGPGDSGGSVIQGTTAVGLISGGTEADPGAGIEQWTWAASLTTALPKTGGYEVALDLDAPAIASPANGASVTPGQTVSGTAPGATSVIVNLGGGDQEVPVSNGAFSFAGPVALGAASISVTSANGFSRSDTTTIAVEVEAAPLAAPIITSPTSGTTLTATVTAISGTGLPTADITVVDGEGNTLGTAVVGGTGTWTVDGLNLGYGAHTVVVTQASAGEVSPEATASFSVVPVAPGVTSIAGGSAFPHDGGPSALSGTGIDGATVTVVLTGVDAPAAKADAGALAALSGVYTTTVAGGTWTVTFPEVLMTGSYTVSARQSVSGFVSSATLVSFSVLGVPAPGGGAVAPGGGGGTGDGNLAATGADALVPMGAAAVALALLSGGLLLMARRRRTIEA